MSTELELATHMEQELTDRNAKTNKSQRQMEEKEFSLKEKHNSLNQINLNNPLIECDQKYKYHFKLLVPVAATFGQYLFGVIIPLSTINELESLNWIYMMYSSVLLVICLVMLLKGYRSKTLLKYNLLHILNIKNPKGIYVIHELKCIGLLLILTTAYLCIVTISFFFTSLYKCRIDATNVDGKCAIYWSGGNETYAFAMSIPYIFLFQSVQCDSEITNAKNKIINKYKNIKQIDDEVVKSLSKWQKRKTFGKRKLEIIISFLCILFFIFVANINRNEVFSNNHPISRIILCLILNATDAAVLAVLFIVGHTIIIHYKFPLVIMKRLSFSINANTIDDVIGWWELRQFYNATINIHISLLKFIIFAALLACTAQSVWVITQWNSRLKAELIYTTVLAVYIICGTFIVIENTVQYHQCQLSHSNTVNKETLQLNRNEYIKYVNNYDDKKTQLMEGTRDKMINNILVDIKENSIQISVLGVRMNTNFMLFLRATVITVFIALIIESK
eukprot:375665_1